MSSGKPKPLEESKTQAIGHKRHRVPIDRISSLPDEILIRILGFSLLRDAVVTGALSRRWRNLWKSLTTFKFNPINKLGVCDHDIITTRSDVRQSRMQSYANWVNGVLQQLQHLRNVEEFSICSYFCEKGSPYLDHWISFAMEKKVRILNINLADDYGYWTFWDSCLFPALDLSKEKASSLTKLSLLGVEICCPGFNNFTFLTTLTLCHITLTDDVCETAFSGCSFLEHLLILGAYKLANLKLVGSSLSRLRYLELYNCSDLKNVEIYAPNLVSFKYSGVRTRFAFNYVPKLVTGRFGTSSYCWHTDLRKGGCNLISYAFSQLDCICMQFETLVMEINTMEVQRLSPLHLCPTFISLKVLELFVDAWCVNCIGLPWFLEACPVLGKFELHIHIYEPNVELESSDQASKASVSPHRFLKEIVLSGFFVLGQSYAMELVQYLAKTAVSLQKLTIFTCLKRLLIASDEILWCKCKVDKQNARERAKQLGMEYFPMAEVLVL